MGHHKPTHPITFRGSGWEYTVQIESPSTPECQEGVPSPIILSEEVIPTSFQVLMKSPLGILSQTLIAEKICTKYHTLASAKTMKCFCFFLFSRVVSFYLTSWLTQNFYVCNILNVAPKKKISQLLQKINQRCDRKQFYVVNRRCISVLFI